MTDHPVKMSAELIKQLNGLPPMCAIETAFQAGADQELEACREWLIERGWFSADGTCLKDLLAARRPKPPTLAEQGLAELEGITTELHDSTGSAFTASAIRAALTRLAELEAQQ